MSAQENCASKSSIGIVRAGKLCGQILGGNCAGRDFSLQQWRFGHAKQCARELAWQNVVRKLDWSHNRLPEAKTGCSQGAKTGSRKEIPIWLFKIWSPKHQLSVASNFGSIMLGAAGVDPEVSQTVTSGLLAAEHNLALAGFTLARLVY